MAVDRRGTACSLLPGELRNPLPFAPFVTTSVLTSPPPKRTFTPAPTLHGPLRFVAELLSLLYLGFIAAIASLTGASYIFFPELGALAHDVFTRPRGAWAGAPFFLALTPVATAVIGTAVTTTMPFGYLSMLLIVGVSVALVQLLRSPIAPAISAGVLPLVLGLKSWWYAPAIFVGTALLALLSWAWRAYCIPRMPSVPASRREIVDDLVELAPRRWAWAPALLAVVVAGVFLVNVTGLRLILFPPLIVVAFEMFGHPSICPWARRPIRLPIACLLTAAGGFLAVHTFGPGVMTTMVSLALGIGVLRLFDLHVPPALAVALIPQVIDHPTWLYPVAIATGTLLVTLIFFPYRWLLLRSAKAGPELAEVSS